MAEKRAVELGLEEDERLEIVAGVEPGDRIVTAGQGGLKDGSTIRILAESADAQASNATSPGDRG